MGSVVHIVCSDTARTGKTLLARVFADLSSLRREDNPVIFDTDTTGNGIVTYFPKKTRMIDLSKVADQVTLFDTMMEAHEKRVASGDQIGDAARVPDFVVDVATSDLTRFFDMYRDIGFEKGAEEAHLDVRIYYMISWTLKSLQRTEQIRNRVKNSRFFAVRNMAVEAFPFTPQPHEADLVPEINISLFLNALSTSVFGMINEKNFSFAQFISGEYKSLLRPEKAEIWDFLEEIHNRTNQRAVC